MAIIFSAGETGLAIRTKLNELITEWNNRGSAADQPASAFQTSNANLTAFSGLTGAADRLAYFTGAGAMALATLTSFVRTLLDDVDAPTARATLGAAAAADPTFTGLMKVEAVKGTGAAISANYSVVAADSGKILIVTASGVTITLPTVATLCPNAGDAFHLDVRNASSGSITITRATSSTMAAGEWATISAVNGQAMAIAKGASVVIS